MLDILNKIQSQVYQLLKGPDRWNTLDIDYHPPRVERLWTCWENDYRVYLHRLHPCEPEQALYHPHP